MVSAFENVWSGAMIHQQAFEHLVPTHSALDWCVKVSVLDAKNALPFIFHGHLASSDAECVPDMEDCVRWQQHKNVETRTRLCKMNKQRSDEVWET